MIDVSRNKGIYEYHYSSEKTTAFFAIDVNSQTVVSLKTNRKICRVPLGIKTVQELIYQDCVAEWNVGTKNKSELEKACGLFLLDLLVCRQAPSEKWLLFDKGCSIVLGEIENGQVSPSTFNSLAAICDWVDAHNDYFIPYLITKRQEIQSISIGDYIEYAKTQQVNYLINKLKNAKSYNPLLDECYSITVKSCPYNNYDEKKRFIACCILTHLAKSIPMDLIVFLGNFAISRLFDKIFNYLEQCKEMGIPFNSKADLREIMDTDKDFSIYRQNTESKKFKEAMGRNAEKLKFSNGNYEVVLPETPLDLIKEGQSQRNCVASYVNSVINGETLIVFVRRKDAKDNSYITCEIRNGYIRQYLLAYNQSITKTEDIAFLEQYKSHLNGQKWE